MDKDNEKHYIYNKVEKKFVSQHNNKKEAYKTLIDKHKFHKDLTVLHPSEFKIYGAQMKEDVLAFSNFLLDEEKLTPKNVVKVEERERSEYDANTKLASTSVKRKSGHYLKRGDEYVSDKAHDTMDGAVSAWNSLSDRKGVKIVKEEHEDVEPLEELSKDTLNSYVKKSKDSEDRIDGVGIAKRKIRGKEFEEANKKEHPVETQWHHATMTKHGYEPVTKSQKGMVRSYEYKHKTTGHKMTLNTGAHSDYWVDNKTDDRGYHSSLETHLKSKNVKESLEHEYVQSELAHKDINSKVENGKLVVHKDNLTKAKAHVKKLGHKIEVVSGLNEEDDPCWKGYKQVGMKTKNGKKVPNCVSEEIEELDEMSGGMTALELHKHLKSKGWELDRTGGGHDVFKHPKSRLNVAVPRHKGELARPTVKQILKKAEINEDDIPSFKNFIQD